jgi:photosystem II stability/assembly factor-like uncharacterized protein
VTVTGWKALRQMSGGNVETLLVDSGGTGYVSSPSSKKPGPPAGTPGVVSSIFETKNHGVTWVAADGDLPAPVSGPMVADPVTPGVLYAWTSLGLYKTVNGGTNWQKLGLNLPEGVYAGHIAIAPTNPNRIYVSTSGASVQCSADGGNTWAQCSNGLYGSTWPGSSLYFVTAMAVSPTNELVAYTTTWRGYLFKTSDGGNTWYPIADSDGEWWVSQIYIAPSNSNVLYALNDEYDSFLGALNATVLTSTDGGNTWTDAGRPDGYASDANQLQILPSDPNTVYATTSLGLYKTTTGGGTWNFVFAPTEGGPSLESVALDSTNSVIYVGSPYSGVYTSTGGSTWQQENQGIFLVRFAGLDACNSAPDTIYAEASGLAPIKTTDSGKTWSQIGNAEMQMQQGMGLACSPSDPSVALASGVYSAGPSLHAPTGNIWKTTDGGQSFTSSYTGLFPGSFGFNPITPDFVNASLQDWQGGYLYSVDGGTTWTQPFWDYKYPGYYTYHPVLANVVFTNAVEYTGYPQNNLYLAYSVDSGSTWTYSQLEGQGSWHPFTTLDQNDPSVLYVAGVITSEGTSGTSGIYKFNVSYGSTNPITSITLTRIPGVFNNGLPDYQDVSQLLYNTASGYLYAATGSGVFRSKDEAASWTSVNADMPYLDVSRIAISPDGVHLYAATNGGIYEIDVR